MLFVIHGIDKPHSLVRSQLLDEHREYLAGSKMRIVASGPLLDDLDRMIGSVVVVECDSREQVDELMVSEPFNKAGLYESLHINRWHQRVGDISSSQEVSF